MVVPQNSTVSPIAIAKRAHAVTERGSRRRLARPAITSSDDRNEHPSSIPNPPPLETIPDVPEAGLHDVAWITSTSQARLRRPALRQDGDRVAPPQNARSPSPCRERWDAAFAPISSTLSPERTRAIARWKASCGRGRRSSTGAPRFRVHLWRLDRRPHGRKSRCWLVSYSGACQQVVDTDRGGRSPGIQATDRRRAL
jgi:hypothetical protein